MSAGGSTIPYEEEENPPVNLDNINTVNRNPRAIGEDETITILDILNRNEENVGFDDLKDIKYRVVTDNAQAILIFRVKESLLRKSAAGGAEKPIQHMTLIDGDIHHTYFSERNSNLDTIFSTFEDSWFNYRPLNTITLTSSRVTQAGGKRKGKGKTRYHRKSKRTHKTRKGKGIK